VRKYLKWGVVAVALAAVLVLALEYVQWQRDRREAALLARAVRYAVEQFTPSYLAYLRTNRAAPRDNMDLNLSPPRDTLWVGLERAELYPNGDVHFEYASGDERRKPLLVWHIDGREDALGGPRVCGARDIPERVLDWNGLDCDAEVAVPPPDAPIPALRVLVAPARAVSRVDDVLEVVRSDDAAALSTLREGGRDLCAASPENYTALGEAARGNQARVIPVLAAACDVNQLEPASGRTALMTAAAMKNVEVARALLAAGADPGIRTADGDTAWFVLGATSDEPSQLIRSMLQVKGVDVNSVAGDQGSLLMRAADAGNAELASWLLSGGARIDLQDKQGRSALMHAALSPNGELMLRLLTARKANLALRDTEGKTALDLLQTLPEGERRREMTQILKAAGTRN